MRILNAPPAMIEPRPLVLKPERHEPEHIADGPFEPQCRRVDAGDGGKAPIRAGQADDEGCARFAGVSLRRDDGQVHGVAIAPVAEERRVAGSELPGAAAPAVLGNDQAWPRPLRREGSVGRYGISQTHFAIRAAAPRSGTR